MNKLPSLALLSGAALLLSACAQQTPKSDATKPEAITAAAAKTPAAPVDPAVADLTNPALTQAERVTFLVNFARRGEIDLLTKALDSGLPIDGHDTLDQTPLLAAVSQNRLDVVQLLLARKADVSAVDKAGWSPLHYATFFGSANDIIDTLLAAGADINAVNDRGITALYFAASTGHEEQVVHLLARGADRNIASKSGYTPLRVAQVRGIESIAKLLEATPPLKTASDNGPTAKTSTR